VTTEGAANKREHILTEAARIFSNYGFKRASVDDIAKQAGVGKGTVYQVAESKEELFILVVEREVHLWHEATAKILDPTVPVEELIMQFEAAAMKLIAKNMLLRDLFRGETMNMLPKWSQRLNELRDIGEKSLVEVIKIGIAQGRWRKELDVEIAGGLLQDFWLGAWMLRPRNLTPEAHMHRILVGLDIIFQGLRVR
jgi:AcrR family transcriptional regulator